MASNLNPMAKPFHIGSEFILSVVEGMLEVVTALLFYCSTFYSLAAKLVLSLPKECSTFLPLPYFFISFIPFISFLPEGTSFHPKGCSCPKGSTNFDKLCKTNPISEMLKMNITKVLTKDYENERLFRCAENKPNQTQFYQSRTGTESTFFVRSKIKYLSLSARTPNLLVRKSFNSVCRSKSSISATMKYSGDHFFINRPNRLGMFSSSNRLCFLTLRSSCRGQHAPKSSP